MMFFHLSLSCSCIIIAQAAKEQISTSHKQRSRRLHFEFPPAPVTPFRGELSAVQSNYDDSRNNKPHDDSNEDSTVEATSRDYNDGESNNHHLSMTSSSSSSRNNKHKIDSFYSSWTPEDFPDPWTNPMLCGGAATASQLDRQKQDHYVYDYTQPSQQQQIIKRPLFCDPDQVLDRQTLRNVMIKLREFSLEFASRKFVEGGDFGYFLGEDAVDNGANNYFVEEQQEEEREKEEDAQDDYDGDTISHKTTPRQEDDSTSKNEAERNRSAGRRRLVRHDVFATNTKSRNKHRRQTLSSNKNNNNDSLSDTETVEVAIALVEKINLPAILRADSYFFYSDQDDMINDAAQYFARYVHDTWSKRLMQEQNDGNVSTNIILIFISVHDRICYISSGTRIATILPWWRLEHVVQDMKPMLRKGRTGDALGVAIDDLTTLIRAGSPTFKDRMDDFFSRFGVVLAFASFTFLFATYGEFQDRRKRVFFAERRSRLNAAEREKARSLQKEFQTMVCPICLEPFGSGSNDKDCTVDTLSPSQVCAPNKEQQRKMKRVDSLGIPLNGNDDKPIKFLRCGHIFDETCWKMWVDSGHGNALMCPVCRQDVGRGKRPRTQWQHVEGDGDNRRHHYTGGTLANMTNDGNVGHQSLFIRIMEHAHTTTAPPTLLRPINSLHTNYSSTLWGSAINPIPDYEDRLSYSYSSTETAPLV